MTEGIIIDKSKTKEEIYRIILPQLKILMENENDLIANMANMTAVLKYHLIPVGRFLSR